VDGAALYCRGCFRTDPVPPPVEYALARRGRPARAR
jgi:hypothetical protein